MKELIRHILREQTKKTPGVKLKTDDFIKRAREIHGNKYDYSKVNYSTTHEPVTIICPIHGPFPQTPASHLMGRGCKPCGRKSAGEKNTFLTKDEIKRLTSKYKSRGEFRIKEPAAYQTMVKNGWTKEVLADLPGGHEDWTKEKIIKLLKDYTNRTDFADEHPNAHMAAIRNGWWNELTANMEVTDSRGERLIDTILKSKEVNFIRQKKFDDCSSRRGKYCRRLPFDFYIEKNRTAIEYDGRQHFEPVYGDEQLEIQKYIDNLKNQYCKKNGIKLIRVPYTMKKEDIEPYILKELGIK
jgi:very-short-patch-repair endonuclease